MKYLWLSLFCITGSVFALADRSDSDSRIPVPTVSAIVTDGQVVATYRIPDGYHIVRQEEFLTFSVETEGYRVGKIEYPVGQKGKSGEEEYSGELALSAPLERTLSASVASRDLRVRLSWQMCDVSGTCFMPMDRTVQVVIDPYTIPNAILPGSTLTGTLGLSEQVPGALANPLSDGTLEGPAISFWIMLVFALLGGLVLNLMPCVLPVLSIKALSLVQNASNDHREVLKGALAYTAGVLTCFATLAVVVMGVKAAGRDVGWGFQFQDWRFVLALALVIWLFCLSLFEVFVITLPGITAIDAVGRKSGHWGSFFSGTFSVLLATPCTAPMLGSAMGYAFSQTLPFIFLFFLAVGLGLALPFLLLGFFPQILRLIPRPGKWMIVFRDVMAFLLAGTVVYLLDILHHQAGNGLFAVLWYLLLASVAAWMYGRFANPTCTSGKRWSFSVLAMALLIAPLPWVVREGNAGQVRLVTAERSDGKANLETGFLQFEPVRINEALQAGNPVFIDFGAKWCATCRTNESWVLHTQTIRDAFRQRGIVPFYADYTNPDPVIAEWLKRYGRAGVPLYLLFHPRATTPHIFPEILTRDMILRELSKLDRSSSEVSREHSTGRMVPVMCQNYPFEFHLLLAALSP